MFDDCFRQTCRNLDTQKNTLSGLLIQELKQQQFQNYIYTYKNISTVIHVAVSFIVIYSISNKIIKYIRTISK